MIGLLNQRPSLGLLDVHYNKPRTLERQAVEADKAAPEARESGTDATRLEKSERLIQHEKAIAYQQAKSVTLEVVTKEGDVVQVHLQNKQAYQEVHRAQDDKSSTARTFGETSSFHYEVQGNLNTQEKAALDNIFQQADSLSQQFFQGDMASVLSGANQMGLDAEAIAGFSLSMQHSEHHSQLETYREIQGMGKEGQAEPSMDLVGAGHFAKDLQSLMDDIGAIFADVQETLKAVFNQIQELQGQASAEDETRAEERKQALDELLMGSLLPLLAPAQAEAAKPVLLEKPSREQQKLEQELQSLLLGAKDNAGELEELLLGAKQDESELEALAA